MPAPPHPTSSHHLTQPSLQPVSSGKRKEDTAAHLGGGQWEFVGVTPVSWFFMSQAQSHFIAQDSALSVSQG